MTSAANNCCCGTAEASCCVETTVVELCGGQPYHVVKRNLICASPAVCAELGGIYYSSFPCGSLPCASATATDCVPCVSEQLCSEITGHTDCQPQFNCVVRPIYEVCTNSSLCELYPECCVWGACCTPAGCINTSQGLCSGVFYQGLDCFSVNCGVSCCCDTDGDGKLDSPVSFPGSLPCSQRDIPCFAYTSGMDCPAPRYTLATCGCNTCDGLTPDCDNNGTVCPGCYFCCSGTPTSGSDCFNWTTCSVDPGCTCEGGLVDIFIWLCQHGYCFDADTDITDVAGSPCVLGLAPCAGLLQQGGDSAAAFLKDATYTSYKLDQGTISGGAIGMANTVDSSSADQLRRITQQFDMGPIELLGFGLVELKRIT